MFHVLSFYANVSVPCSLVVTCWERADLQAPLYVMFYYVCVTFPYMYVPSFTLELRVKLVQLNMFKPSSNFLTDRYEAAFLCGSFFSYLCLSLPYCHDCFCSFVVTYWEGADLLSLLYVIFLVFLSLSYMVSIVWCGT